ALPIFPPGQALALTDGPAEDHADAVEIGNALAHVHRYEIDPRLERPSGNAERPARFERAALRRDRLEPGAVLARGLQSDPGRRRRKKPGRLVATAFTELAAFHGVVGKGVEPRLQVLGRDRGLERAGCGRRGRRVPAGGAGRPRGTAAAGAGGE